MLRDISDLPATTQWGLLRFSAHSSGIMSHPVSDALLYLEHNSFFPPNATQLEMWTDASSMVMAQQQKIGELLRVLEPIRKEPSHQCVGTDDSIYCHQRGQNFQRMSSLRNRQDHQILNKEMEVSVQTHKINGI